MSVGYGMSKGGGGSFRSLLVVVSLLLVYLRVFEWNGVNAFRFLLFGDEFWVRFSRFSCWEFVSPFFAFLLKRTQVRSIGYLRFVIRSSRSSRYAVRFIFDT